MMELGKMRPSSNLLLMLCSQCEALPSTGNSKGSQNLRGSGQKQALLFGDNWLPMCNISKTLHYKTRASYERKKATEQNKLLLLESN